MRRVLHSGFFDRPTLRVARELLGKYLVRRVGSKIVARKITEVEAYIGFRDKASHASRGRTERNAPMFGPAGRWYVYFTYGMHWILNIVTGRKDYPAAVLIRGIENLNGPAKLTKFLNVDKRFNDRPASRKTGLWIEDRGLCVPPRLVKRGPRIGVDYAGEWKDKYWRFYIAEDKRVTQNRK